MTTLGQIWDNYRTQYTQFEDEIISLGLFDADKLIADYDSKLVAWSDLQHDRHKKTYIEFNDLFNSQSMMTDCGVKLRRKFYLHDKKLICEYTTDHFVMRFITK